MSKESTIQLLLKEAARQTIPRTRAALSAATGISRTRLENCFNAKNRARFSDEEFEACFDAMTRDASTGDLSPGAVIISCAAWCNETFGLDRDLDKQTEKLEEEVEEMRDALRAYSESGLEEDLRKLGLEIADCMIVLINISAALGLDVIDMISEKMSINLKRKFTQGDDGIYSGSSPRK